MGLNIVLLEPEIPQNTGNIARTCAATGSSLHLVKPLGFSTEDKYLKRAGLDYWDLLDIYYYENFDDFLGKAKGSQILLVTTKSDITYTDVAYEDNCFIVLGKETKGIPEEILVKHHEKCVRIPMITEARSLNLSNAAAIMVYEAHRQWGFRTLQKEGTLHRLKWEE